MSTVTPPRPQPARRQEAQPDFTRAVAEAIAALSAAGLQPAGTVPPALAPALAGAAEGRGGVSEWLVREAIAADLRGRRRRVAGGLGR